MTVICVSLPGQVGNNHRNKIGFFGTYCLPVELVKRANIYQMVLFQ